MIVMNHKMTFAPAPFLLLFCACLAATGCSDAASENGGQTVFKAGETGLTAADAALHRRLQAVYEADDRYDALLAANAVRTELLDEKNGDIIQAEMALQKTIDSLQQAPAAGADSSALARLTGYFKTTLQNRRFLSDMRMIASAESDDSTAMQQALLRLRAEVDEKTKRIARLEQQAGAAPKQASVSFPATATPLERKLLSPEASRQIEKTAAATPANGESLAQLKQRNKNLATALNAVQTQYGTLSKYYRELKQDYDRAQTELANLRKAANR